MLIAGLIVGPILGLLLGDVLRDYVRPWWAAMLLMSTILLVFLALPVLQTEFRVGLTAGILLGVLVSASPMRVHEDIDAAWDTNESRT